MAPTSRSAKAPGRRLSLLWLVFLANGSVLLVAFLLLALSPVEIHAPITTGQLGILFAGFAAMLVVNVIVLRRVLSPLLHLVDVMSAIDPDRPGRRLEGVHPRSAEGVALEEAFNDMLDRLESGRREAARMVLSAQEAEKSRVGRELHDEIGQTLTATMIKAERAAEGDPELAVQELTRVAGALRTSLDDVRRIAHELRPEALDDLGLINALIALCSRFDTAGGLRVRRQLQTKLPPLSDDVELVIYRVAQESLTNVARHADASSATVAIEAHEGSVVLSVSDDGRGMQSEAPHDTAGISGMRERAMLIDARLEIDASPNEGTVVRLTVPIDDAAR